MVHATMGLGLADHEPKPSWEKSSRRSSRCLSCCPHYTYDEGVYSNILVALEISFDSLGDVDDLGFQLASMRAVVRAKDQRPAT